MALQQRKALGQASASVPSQSKPGLVTTATLVRGRVYFFRNEKFELGVTRVVPDELANDLEELHDTIKDTDGDYYEKPFFDVQRAVPAPTEAPDPKQVHRQAVRLPVRRPMPTAAR